MGQHSERVLTHLIYERLLFHGLKISEGNALQAEI